MRASHRDQGPARSQKAEQIDARGERRGGCVTHALPRGLCLTELASARGRLAASPVGTPGAHEHSTPEMMAEASCTSTDSVFVEVFGWIGCAAAWLLFVSPLPTMRKVCQRGYVGDFSALPYLITTLNCGLWAVYALPWVTPCKMQPLVTNVVGFTFELVCECLPSLHASPCNKQCLHACHQHVTP